MRKWQLYVDESGDFDGFEEGGPRLVAGLLISGGRDRGLEQRLRAAVCAAFPGVAYPPHSTVLMSPLGLLAETSRSELGAVPSLRRACDAALEALARGPHAAFAEGLRRGRMGTKSERNSADTWLRGELPGAHAQLRAACEDYRGGQRLLLSKVPELCGAHAACLVGAVSYPSLERPPEGSDHYLSVLADLCERLLMLLRGPSADEQIWARVAGRNVTVPGEPKMPMTARAVGWSVKAAMRLPPRPESGLGERVRIVPDVPCRYDELVHPGVVLADIVCNRLRRILHNASMGWAAHRQQLAGELPLPVMLASRLDASDDPLPTLAAHGRAQAAISAAFGGTAPALESVPAGWRRDQAAAWVQLAQRGGHT